MYILSTDVNDTENKRQYCITPDPNPDCLQPFIALMIYFYNTYALLYLFFITFAAVNDLVLPQGSVKCYFKLASFPHDI